MTEGLGNRVWGIAAEKVMGPPPSGPKVLAHENMCHTCGVARGREGPQAGVLRVPHDLTDREGAWKLLPQSGTADQELLGSCCV